MKIPRYQGTIAKTRLALSRQTNCYSGFTSGGRFVAIPAHLIEDASRETWEDGSPFYSGEELYDSDLWEEFSIR